MLSRADIFSQLRRLAGGSGLQDKVDDGRGVNEPVRVMTNAWLGERLGSRRPERDSVLLHQMVFLAQRAPRRRRVYDLIKGILGFGRVVSRMSIGLPPMTRAALPRL